MAFENQLERKCWAWRGVPPVWRDRPLGQRAPLRLGVGGEQRLLAVAAQQAASRTGKPRRHGPQAPKPVFRPTTMAAARQGHRGGTVGGNAGGAARRPRRRARRGQAPGTVVASCGHAEDEQARPSRGPTDAPPRLAVLARKAAGAVAPSVTPANGRPGVHEADGRGDAARVGIRSVGASNRRPASAVTLMTELSGVSGSFGWPARKSIATVAPRRHAPRERGRRPHRRHAARGGPRAVRGGRGRGGGGPAAARPSATGTAASRRRAPRDERERGADRRHQGEQKIIEREAHHAPPSNWMPDAARHRPVHHLTRPVRPSAGTHAPEEARRAHGARRPVGDRDPRWSSSAARTWARPLVRRAATTRRTRRAQQRYALPTCMASSRGSSVPKSPNMPEASMRHHSSRKRMPAPHELQRRRLVCPRLGGCERRRGSSTSTTRHWLAPSMSGVSSHGSVTAPPFCRAAGQTTTSLR